MADSVAPLPARPLPPTSPDFIDSLEGETPWRSAEPKGNLKDPNSDSSSFLAERGFYRFPHSY